MSRTIALVTIAVIAATAHASGQTLRSPSLAKQLGQALSAKHLDAIAAPDPTSPDRFVAALFYPGTQLLVVSAQPTSVPALNERLSWDQYKEIYLDLQSNVVPGSSWVVYDMKADGLCNGPDQVADTLYDGAKPVVIFSGDEKKRSPEYEASLTSADERYSALLSALLEETKQP